MKFGDFGGQAKADGESSVEVAFTGEVPVQDGNKDNLYTLLFNGSADRVDGYVDDDGCLHVRIIDYKTGRRENKQNEIDMGIQIQHIIYAMAVEKYFADDEGRAILKTIFADELAGRDDFSDIVFDWVGYTFPYETKENYTLDATGYIYGKEPFVFGSDDAGQDIPADHDATDSEVQKKDAIRFSPTVISKISHTIGYLQTDREGDFNREVDDMIAVSIVNRNRYWEQYSKENHTQKKTIDQKEFCQENYCRFKDMCRKWLGDKAGEGEEPV